MKNSIPEGEIKALTSLRGVAALGVMLTHFCDTAQWHAASTIPSLVPHGYMGVDFFFVLSGFIMSYTYGAAFERDGLSAYGPFLLKRVARIVPLNIVVTLSILPLGFLATSLGARKMFFSDHVMEVGIVPSTIVTLSNLQVFSPAHNLNPPSWSVSAEVLAYLLFPLLGALALARGRLLPIASTAAAFAVLALQASGQPRLGLGEQSVPFNITRCLVEFVFGMIAYRCYRRGRGRWLGEDRWTLLASAVGVALLVVRVDLAIVASFPFIVLAWAYNRGRAGRWMSSALPYFLGTISFSIYLLHELFRGPALALLRAASPAPVSTPVALAFAVVGSLAVLPFATLAFYAVERPGRLAIKAIADRLQRRRGSTEDGEARST